MADNNKNVNKPYEEQPLNNQNVPELKDEKASPIHDGAIPQDSQGIATQAYDSLNPSGDATLQFQEGNYHTLLGLPKVAADKVAQLSQTLMPLVIVAMIELLGSSNQFIYRSAQCTPSFDTDGKMSIEFNFQFLVQNFIGQDIELEAIQHDANFILEKIKPCKANITKCEIDCSNGLITIMGSI